MESVVYWLGAGFSAPLGLPVMSNFLMKSKDQYFSDPEKFEHFKLTFDRIEALAKTKNFYSADLHNIEEILSLLEMNAFLTGDETAKDQFIQYLRDVIIHHSPAVEIGQLATGTWSDFMFGDQLRRSYGAFVTSLLGINLRKIPVPPDGAELHCDANESPEINYSVVTVNYDLVLESFASALDNASEGLVVKFSGIEDVIDHGYVPLAKLHGSVDSKDLVAPTWNKTFHPEIERTWKIAHRVLSNANHLRFIGYSLPESDSYVRFLLKSAALESGNLKSIDVICLDDPQGTVKRRYDDFIDFPNYRFEVGTTEEYLSRNAGLKRRVRVPERGPLESETIDFLRLEDAHSDFFSNEVRFDRQRDPLRGLR